MMRTLLLLLAFSLTALGQYVPPTGIPAPAWGATDPINDPVPAQPGGWPSAEVAGYYYIDPDHGSATDSNTYGYPDVPRLTIPEEGTVTYSAGDRIEIHGDYSDSQTILSFAGVEGNPVWVVGGANMTFVNMQIIVKGSYVIFDGIKNGESATASIQFRVHSSSTADHGCVRNSTFIGDGTNQGNSGVLSAYGNPGVRFDNFIFYGNLIHSFGDDDAVAENDFHGITTSTNADNVWILNNTVYEMGGDSTQIGTASTADTNRVDSVYIADNTFHSNLENAIDIKEADNVIIAYNECYDFLEENTLGGVAIVIHNEPTNVWVIGNRAYDSSSGIVTTSGDEIYVMANRIWNIHHDPADVGWDPTSGYAQGVGIHFRGSTNVYAIDNSLYDYDIGLQMTTGNTNNVFHGNIFSNRAEVTGDDIRIANSGVAAATTMDYNLYESMLVYWAGTDYTTPAALNSGESQGANSLAGDPLFTSGGTGDLSIPVGSPAVDVSVEHAAYATFLANYSIDIRVDYLGKTRPFGGVWDMGAFEYGSAQNPATAIRNRNSASRAILSAQ